MEATLAIPAVEPVGLLNGRSVVPMLLAVAIPLAIAVRSLERRTAVAVKDPVDIPAVSAVREDDALLKPRRRGADILWEDTRTPWIAARLDGEGRRSRVSLAAAHRPSVRAAARGAEFSRIDRLGKVGASGRRKPRRPKAVDSQLRLEQVIE
jgi:hypothetical protein